MITSNGVGFGESLIIRNRPGGGGHDSISNWIGSRKEDIFRELKLIDKNQRANIVGYFVH